MLYIKVSRTVAIISIPFLFLLGMAILLGFLLTTLPDVGELRNCLTTSMNRVELCSKSQSYVRLANISPLVVDAVLASEDASFFSHDGFDWFEIRESFETNVKRGRLARGGSTITQQLVKNVFLDKEKSIIRKIREAFLTKEVEKKFSKQDILEKYLNVVEFGPNIFGIKAATQYYFQKLPSQVNLLEASFLAFLLPNPKGHHVYFKKGNLTDYARKRILGICTRLYRFKKISSADWEIASFRLIDFPWKGLIWEKTEMMDTVDEILKDETGNSDFEVPVIEEEMPENDPEAHI